MRYPNKIKITQKSNINYSNRGMLLENDLNATNEYYLLNDIAIIYKKPTPITIHRVNFKNRKDAIIEEARFKIPSTTDYNGIYKSRYIDFEAKETTKDYFPLSNIHAHQIKHLQSVNRHGAISFIIVRFTKKNKTFLLQTEKLSDFLNNETRKSIPLEYFEKNAYIIKDKYNPRVDYIEILNKLYFEGEKI